MKMQKTSETYRFSKRYYSRQMDREYTATIYARVDLDTEHLDKNGNATHKLTICNETHNLMTNRSCDPARACSFVFENSDPARAEAVARLIEYAAQQLGNQAPWEAGGIE